MDLNELRQQIDAIDQVLVDLFTQRMEISARIGEYKKKHGLPIYAPAREQEKLEEVSRLSGEEMAEYTRALYSTLFSLSRSYQDRCTAPDVSLSQQAHRAAKCGLLGEKLVHSYSPDIHHHLGTYSYELFERSPGELADFFEDPALHGCNVTIPYKKAVIPYLDDLTDLARRLGSVNTILRREDGTLIGHNTDYYGFRKLLAHSGLEPAGKKCLVLGSGGASATVQAALADSGAKVVVISRTGENNYRNLERHRDAAIIVNTTPVGMFPNNGEAPLSLATFPDLEGVLDLIYNPARTSLLLQAEKQGLTAENGLYMLVAQAKESAEWFCGHPIPDEKVDEVYSILRNRMENIILIGMPGSGKSTVGRLLAQKTGRLLADADEEFTRQHGFPPSQVISQQGEAAFRAMETALLSRLSKESGIILATGGGCVVCEENYEILHQNGRIFHLLRDLRNLPAENRPLSQRDGVDSLWQARAPLYRRFADYAVDNNGSPQAAADQILSIQEGEQK